VRIMAAEASGGAGGGETKLEDVYPAGAEALFDATVPDPSETLGGKTDDIEPDAPNVIMHVVKQLMPGQDLTRVTIPSFYLESRSLLEKLADVMMHPQLIIDASAHDDPAERMLSVTRWFLSGWHYKTVGVKKPYNPVIGETFACAWTHEDGSRSQYFAEQVSHRPPVSAMFMENRRHNITANAQVWTQSRFKAPQTAVSIMAGGVRLRFTDRDEEYFITLPSFFAHGLLLGTLRMEIGGDATIVCEKTGHRADIKFKQKPMMSGEYNVVQGSISVGKAKLFDIAGKWDTQLDVIDRRAKKKSELLVDVRREPIAPKEVLPIDKQGPWESRRLWAGVTAALQKRPTVDWMAVDRLKGKIEDDQRTLPCHQEGAAFRPWKTKCFRLVPFSNPLTGETEEVWEMVHSRYTPYAAGEKENNVLWLSRMTADDRTGEAESIPGVDGAAAAADEGTAKSTVSEAGRTGAAAAGEATATASGGAGGASAAAPAATAAGTGASAGSGGGSGGGSALSTTKAPPAPSVAASAAATAAPEAVSDRDLAKIAAAHKHRPHRVSLEEVVKTEGPTTFV